MTFVNYKNSNNASSNLIADISASATVILITSWDQALFPNSYPFLLTIEKVNSDWNVILREIVKVVSWNQNSFVVVRWAWTCVQDDTASQRVQWNSTHSFSAWDRISLYWTAEQVKDIQDDLNSKLSIEEYQSWNYVYWASTTWNDDYAITLPIAPTSYTIWQVFRFLAWTANTWPATLNVNGLWAVAIKKNHDIALDTWDIEAWQIVEVAYDWTNFQMNSQTATIVDMKDIKTTSFSWLKAWEQLQEWDVVQITNKWFDWSVATTSNALWWVSWVKWWIWFTSNGELIQNLQIKASIIEWTTPTAITVNLETDDNGSPSWTSLWSKDILSSFYANVNISSITETYTNKHYGLAGNNWRYIWWWNLWKTRCFYRIQSSWGIASDSTYTIYRNILNDDSSDAYSYIYTIPWSVLLSALWLTANTNVVILHIDQDFNFLFVYDYYTTKKIFKLWFQAPKWWWEISSFTNLWERNRSILWLPNGSPWTSCQLAFSDDWMFVYIIPYTLSTTTGEVHSYQLSSPYDLTSATEIWTSWSLSTYAWWPCYMSLSNWKKYIVAWYSYNRYIKAREINSDWTIGSTDITIRSWDNDSYSQYWFCIWNYSNGWASVCINHKYSSTLTSYFYTLWSSLITSPALIDFSFSNSIQTTAWNKYRITIAPTWWSVENFMNLYSYEWNEQTSLSSYTDSWSSVSNRSPYLRWDWIKALYIIKQTDSNIPFWNYGIIDNDYQAFSQARFVNLWISNHNLWLIPWRKYFMENWELNLDSWQYVWTAINETTLNIWNEIKEIEKDVSSKINNIVAAESWSSQRSTSKQGCLFTAKTSWYYTAIWTIAATSTANYLKFYVDWTQEATQTIVCWSSWTNRSFVCIPVYLNAWQSWYLQPSTAVYIWHMFIVWPDWSV